MTGTIYFATWPIFNREFMIILNCNDLTKNGKTESRCVKILPKNNISRKIVDNYTYLDASLKLYYQ